jgi:hypothetical protein
MTAQEQEQFDALTKESIELSYKIHKELGYYLFNERCPSTGSMEMILKTAVQLKGISNRIMWLTAPSFLKEP